MSELIVEVDLAVFAPHALKWLELHYKLPVSVEHLTLSFYEGPSVIVLTAVENW